MWKQDKWTSRQIISGLLERIKPYVVSCHTRATNGDGWGDNTPNILLQQAALLCLASQMWRDEDAASSRLWVMTAEERMSRALKLREPGNAFGYSYGSGVDANYFIYDANYLTRYYMLTGDKAVADALKDMAVAASSATMYGQPVSIGSPWWKHTFTAYNYAGSISEQVLVLSKDPSYAALVELARKRLFNADPLDKRYSSFGHGDIGIYYNMLMPEITIAVTPLENRFFFSKVENGPAMRYEGLNITMPWRSWCESTCGATYATPDAVGSQLCSVILTAVTRDVNGRDAKSHFPIAYSVVEDENPVPDIRAVAIGGDFIASATVFRPALGGPALPQFANRKNESPWQRTDIYFSDKNGFAGSLMLKALDDNDSTRVALWAHVSDDQKIAGNEIKLKGMTVALDGAYSGKIVNRGKTWGYSAGYYPLTLLESVIKESGPEGFKKGDAFRATVTMNADGSRGLKAGQCAVKDELYQVEIMLGDAKRAMLVFNRSNVKKQYPWSRDYQVGYKSTESGEVKPITRASEIEIPAGALIVFVYQ